MRLEIGIQWRCSLMYEEIPEYVREHALEVTEVRWSGDDSSVPAVLFGVLTRFIVLFVLYCIVFIHFYSASRSTCLSEALPITATDTVSEFTRRSVTFNCN